MRGNWPGSIGTAIVVLVSFGGWTESPAQNDSPMQIELCAGGTERARAALQDYYESRKRFSSDLKLRLERQADKEAPASQGERRSPGFLRRGTSTPSAEEVPQPDSDVEQPQIFDLKEGEKPTTEDRPTINRSSYRDLKSTRGYFTNRGGDLRYYQRSTDLYPNDFSNAQRIRRSNFERVLPFRGEIRQQQRTTFRSHLSREGRRFRTRNSYR